MNAVMAKSNPPPAASRSRAMTVLVSSLPLLFVMDVFLWIAFVPNALRGHSDFRQLYVAGYMVRHGYRHDLYNYDLQTKLQANLVTQQDLALPFIRPAYEALLIVPLTPFSYRAAYLLFLIMNVALVGLCLCLLKSWVPNLVARWRALLGAIVVAFLPINVALMQGQDSVLLLTIVMAAMACSTRGHRFYSGLILGLGVFKLQVIVPIAMLFVLWRRWRVVAGLAISTTSMALLSVAVTGFAGVPAFLGSLVSVGGVTNSKLINFPIRLQVMSNLRGLISCALANSFSSGEIRAVVVLISAILMIALAVLVPARWKNPLPIAITAAALVSYYLFVHDLSVLLIPILFLLEAACLPVLSERNFAAWAAVLAYVAPLCLIAVPAHFYITCFAYCALLAAALRTTGSMRSQIAREDPPVLQEQDC